MLFPRIKVKSIPTSSTPLSGSSVEILSFFKYIDFPSGRINFASTLAGSSVEERAGYQAQVSPSAGSGRNKFIDVWAARHSTVTGPLRYTQFSQKEDKNRLNGNGSRIDIFHVSYCHLPRRFRLFN
jgi:exonuclease III